MPASDLATVTASTKRAPAPSSDRIGSPVAHLASLSITPLQSIEPELALELNIRDPREAKKTHVFAISGSLPDVEEGDILVISSTEYTIRAVAEFNDDLGRFEDGSYARLIIEQRKMT